MTIERKSVLITGSGRSGTSMVAGTIMAGYNMERDLYAPRHSNPKGFFEGPEVNRMNEDILSRTLAASGSDHYDYGQRWLCDIPEGTALNTDLDLDQRLKSLTANTPFCYKDPRFSYTYPAWRPHLPEHKVVCVFRHPAITVASILKECSDMEYLCSLDIDEDKAYKVWTSIYSHISNHHFDPERWLAIHFEQMLTPEGLDRLEAFLGHGIDRCFPDPRLRRSKPLPSGAPEEAEELYVRLCALAGYHDPLLDKPREQGAK